jgi:hypothetical protein
MGHGVTVVGHVINILDSSSVSSEKTPPDYYSIRIEFSHGRIRISGGTEQGTGHVFFPIISAKYAQTGHHSRGPSSMKAG